MGWLSHSLIFQGIHCGLHQSTASDSADSEQGVPQICDGAYFIICGVISIAGKTWVKTKTFTPLRLCPVPPPRVILWTTYVNSNFSGCYLQKLASSRCVGAIRYLFPLALALATSGPTSLINRSVPNSHLSNLARRNSARLDVANQPVSCFIYLITMVEPILGPIPTHIGPVAWKIFMTSSCRGRLDTHEILSHWVGLSTLLTNLYAVRSVRYNMSVLPPIPPDISRV